MVMTAFSVSGYSCTGSEPTARRPSTRIRMLTAMASTGRAMKRSVKRFIGLFVRRVGVGAVGRLHRIIHRNRRAVTQLELPGRHHLIARIDPGQHRDLIAARVAEGHENLPG